MSIINGPIEYHTQRSHTLTAGAPSSSPESSCALLPLSFLVTSCMCVCVRERETVDTSTSIRNHTRVVCLVHPFTCNKNTHTHAHTQVHVYIKEYTKAYV